MKPLILLSNDDGFDAHGLLALKTELACFASVIVCAPSQNQSASSHAITLHSVLRLTQIDETTFALDGTPADCIYVALHSKTRILPSPPDMVVSGMNHGPNLGVDVIYSGTVAAAREGAQRGIPSVAVSTDVRAEYAVAAAVGAGVVQRLWKHLQQGAAETTPLLNVNIPRNHSGKLQATQTGKRRYNDDVVYRKDPRNRQYLWIGGSRAQHDGTIDTDTGAWDAGKASVTPLTLDLNAPQHAAICKAIV